MTPREFRDRMVAVDRSGFEEDHSKADELLVEFIAINLPDDAEVEGALSLYRAMAKLYA